MRVIGQLSDVLEPVRDIYVSALLESMARELGRGSDIDAEPVDRDVDGRIRRRQPLDLPSRYDLRVTRAGRSLMMRVPAETVLRFAPVSAPISDVAAVRIAPFCWGSTVIHAASAAGRPNWTPVRRWFLEWFQARFGEESPDLLGVAHAIEGPVATGGGWRFTVDLGSASVSGFLAMLEAFGETGCARINVGETEDAI